MRIAIVGLGGIGGVVAVRLARALRPGESLELAAGRSAAKLREAGLRIEGEPPPPALTIAETLQDPCDLLLLCTRTDELESALAPAVPLLARDGAVVCLQNGLPEERAARLVGPDRTLGAVIGWSAHAEGPGRYRVTGGGRFTLGACAPETAAAGTVARAREILSRAFPIRVTANLAGARWSKLAMNCAMSTLGAVSGLDLGDLAASKEGPALASRILAEAVAVARARHVRLARVAGLDPAWLAEGSRLPAFARRALIRLGAQRRPRQKSGMLLRLLEGRPAGQIDDLNGLVAREARSLGLSAPLNEELVRTVHAIERKEEQIGPGQLSRLAAARGIPPR